jgi:hypothetical protein
MGTKNVKLLLLTLLWVPISEILIKMFNGYVRLIVDEPVKLVASDVVVSGNPNSAAQLLATLKLI